LVCRTYDCRDDVREKLMVKVKHPPDTVFDSRYPDRCTHCDRPLRLCMGVKRQCGGFPVCIDCGQPYDLKFNYPDRVFRIEPVAGVPAPTRRRNLLNCLSYREQWAEANAVLDAWCAESPRDAALERERALVLAELGKLADARRRLQALRHAEPSVELDLAWLDTREQNDGAAQRRIESVLEELAPGDRLRAQLQLGAIARRAGRIEEAARCFQRAILIDRVQPPYDHGIKEYLLELMHGSEETRARVERGLLHKA
jgi:tetratricopeptide (TPR) repeat protein